MSSLRYKLFVFVIYCCLLPPPLPPFVITISVRKTAGSQYFGIMPAKNAKVTHRTLPTPSDEGYRILSDASYYYNEVSNGVYNVFKQFFGTSDEQDPQIHQGVYKCDKGVCKMLALDNEQTSAFHEKLKGKRIQTGNALTTKVKQQSQDYENDD